MSREVLLSPEAMSYPADDYESEAAYDPYAYPGDYDMHTGDPKQDLAYERQYEQQTYQVIPEVIKNFIQYFHKTVSDLIDQKVYELQASRVSSDVIDQKVYEIQDIYENSWTKLTERFFKNTPWPEAEAIAPQVGNDAVFLILYKEFYYRHIYAKVSGGPSLEQRFESYYNYCNLFNYILNADGPAPLELPNQWLWDIIDEFIYQSMYSRVPECQVTTYYYVGFAYLMMHRYQDAIRVFANILLYIQRTKSMFQRTTYKYEMINKQNEQMLALLAIALTMYPMRIDESIHLQLRKKYRDKMLRMQKGDPQVYEELFSYSCPKFLSPVVPNYDNVHPNYHKEPFLQQLKVFSDEVQQQAQLSTIRSFLKLYTTMPVAKLAGFLDLTEQEFRIQLLVFKHKMKNLVWTSGISALDGEFQSASEVDFYIDKDMIHIADTKVARRYGDFFIRQIHKFEELNRTLKKMGQRP
uniref:Eukaryotic translation initiation factor 3 subunit L n=1 Tax=Canis lupus dingo TaxID=286419 RepID=A0A8C0LC45_CANLU